MTRAGYASAPALCLGVLGMAAACGGGKSGNGEPAAVEAPYGTWRSPLTATRATAGALRLGQIAVDGDDVYWLEGRASEGGRNVLVRSSAGSPPVDVSPEGFNIRTRVHEYGGAAYTVHEGAIYASNFADQKLYAIATGGAPKALTPDGYFYAQCSVDTDTQAPPLRAGGSHLGRRAAARVDCGRAARCATAVRGCRARAGRGLLLGSDAQPRRPSARVAAVAAPEHAMGWHRTLRGGPRRAWRAWCARARGGRARRVDLPAPVVVRRRALLRVRPFGLVEPVSPSRRGRRVAHQSSRRSSAGRNGASAPRPMRSRPRIASSSPTPSTVAGRWRCCRSNR